MEIKSIAIIGTGTIGASWAAFYSSKDFSVKLFDTNREVCLSGFEAVKAAKATIDDLLRNDLITAKSAACGMRNLFGY